MNYKRLYNQLIASGSKDKFPLSHGHHIIPKHIGGTDDEWNFVFLTVKQHALAHRLLWKMDGRWQDKLAWQGLKGWIGEEDIRHQIAIANGKGRKGHPISEEHRAKIAKASLGNKRAAGCKRSPEHLAKLKIAQRNALSRPLVTELGIFKNAKIAAEYHNCSRETIRQRLIRGEYEYCEGVTDAN